MGWEKAKYFVRISKKPITIINSAKESHGIVYTSFV